MRVMADIPACSLHVGNVIEVNDDLVEVQELRDIRIGTTPIVWIVTAHWRRGFYRDENVVVLLEDDGEPESDVAIYGAGV